MIYAIMHAYYSDWQLYGYFTTREEAEKYVVKYPEKELHIEELECFDGREDLSNIKVRYMKPIIFRLKDNSWLCEDNGVAQLYQATYPKSNIVVWQNNDWVRVWVNTTSNDLELQKKIAQDIFYQYLDSCDGSPDDKTMKDFNKILSAEEDARKELEKQEKIKQKELRELARLKEKYEK